MSGETYIMVSHGGEGSKVVDKFDGMNFHLWKFKMEMVMAKKELSEIVDGSEELLILLPTLVSCKHT